MNDEDIKTVKVLRDKVNEFRDPKTFWHLYEKKGAKMVKELINTYTRAMFHPLIRKVLAVSSDIRRKMSEDSRYEGVFREVERRIGETIKSIQSLIPRYEELNAPTIVQILQDIEERAGKLREAILNIAQEMLQEYEGDEIAEEAILDCRNAYLAFLDSLTAMTYLELHTYVCPFFEATRYPGGRKIPKDVIVSLPQIINLLRENLDRVRRLVKQY